jgi:hypothetical protein
LLADVLLQFGFDVLLGFGSADIGVRGKGVLFEKFLYEGVGSLGSQWKERGLLSGNGIVYLVDSRSAQLHLVLLGRHSGHGSQRLAEQLVKSGLRLATVWGRGGLLACRIILFCKTFLDLFIY